MKNNLFITETALSILLILFTVLFCKPLQAWWMPTMASSVIAVVLVALFVIFAIFIWKENSKDEREELHRLTAGRAGFLVGSGILVAGIIIQSFQHTLDSWLIVTLCTMIIAKVAVHWYQSSKK